MNMLYPNLCYNKMHHLSKFHPKGPIIENMDIIRPLFHFVTYLSSSIQDGNYVKNRRNAFLACFLLIPTGACNYCTIPDKQNQERTIELCH